MSIMKSLIKALLILAVSPLTSLNASAEKAYAYCHAAVGPSDTFYFSAVFQYDSESANALGRDFSSFAPYLFAHYNLQSTPYTGFCASAKTREDAAHGLNGDAAMYKRTGIKYVFTTWTPSE
jgi:hypothetical protein